MGQLFKRALKVFLSLVFCSLFLLSLLINFAAAAPLQIDSTSPLPVGAPGEYYETDLYASGGTAPYTWSFIGGVLPSGMIFSIQNSIGVIQGTPQSGTAGNYNITMQVTDSLSNVASKTYDLLLTDGPPSFHIATDYVPAGVVNTLYHEYIQSYGGTAPYTFSLAQGVLPAGITLDSSGLLGGTPTVTGDYFFTVEARDALSQVDTREFSLVVNPTDGLAISTANPLPVGQPNVYYETNFQASGGVTPYSWWYTGAHPSGLNFTGGYAASAIMNGTPTSEDVGMWSITVYVQDSLANTVSKQFDLSIQDIALSNITGSLKNKMGLPVPYAPVKLQKSGGGTIMGSADINGDFSFANLEDGLYKITTRLIGYRFRPVLVTVSGSDQNVTITSDMSLWDMKRKEKYLTDSNAPGMPSGVTVNAVSSSEIEVKWNVPSDNVGVSGYRIFDGGGSYLATTVTNQFRATGLSGSTLYCFRVTAFDGVGNESAQSGQVCDTTP